MSARRSGLWGARAFRSLPPACCRRREARLATSAFESPRSVVQRCFTKLSGNMPEVAVHHARAPRPVRLQRVI
jgi:hypothetical protein